MRIDALDVYYVAHPLIEPWTTAYGSDPVIYSVMVKLTSGGGNVLERILSVFGADLFAGMRLRGLLCGQRIFGAAGTGKVL